MKVDAFFCECGNEIEFDEDIANTKIIECICDRCCKTHLITLDVKADPLEQFLKHALDQEENYKK